MPWKALIYNFSFNSFVHFDLYDLIKFSLFFQKRQKAITVLLCSLVSICIKTNIQFNANYAKLCAVVTTHTTFFRFLWCGKFVYFPDFHVKIEIGKPNKTWGNGWTNKTLEKTSQLRTIWCERDNCVATLRKKQLILSVLCLQVFR